MDAIRWQGDRLALLDQRKLPCAEVWSNYAHHKDVAEAIRTLTVRGAPAIGISAGYAYCLAAMEYKALPPAEFSAAMTAAKAVLAASRPTAVNLFWALERMERCLAANGGTAACIPALIAEAEAIHREDTAMNLAMSEFGAPLVPEHAAILTHCNAGPIATSGRGTALGVIFAAHAQGKLSMVYADETRPLLQGARLTAWELVNAGVPTTLICDSMAGALMAAGKIDMVIVGCDRMAANGDFANKIGTYSLAVLAKHHGVPFYTALPSSTIDLSLPDGSGIVVEERDGREITHFAGVQTAPLAVSTYNPAFDVTPHALLTAAITERGVIRAPFPETLAALFG